MTRTILRWTLRLAPRSFRGEFGSEIEADFEEGLREARARGRCQALAFTIRNAWDLGRSGLRERWERPPRTLGAPYARRTRRESFMRSTIGQDAKFAWRGLYRSPTFTAVAVIALALGIGANSALFSVVNAVLLSPLPYDRSEDLVRVWSSWTQFPRGSVSEPEYYDYQKSDSIEALAAFTFPHDATLAFEDGEPEPVTRTFVTASLFRVLGARAIHGRALEDEENQPGKGDVAVLSYGLWQRKFASDPEILGRTIRVQAKAVEVVGIMPAWFQYPDVGVDLWLPLTLNPEDPRGRGGHFLRAVARLKEGASLESARTELAVVAARLEREFPENYPGGAGFGVLVLPLADDLVAEVKPALMILLGAVGFVLLIACANVANLLLARAAGRERELAVRKALGASQWSVLRQLLTESLFLSVFSGAVALILANWMMGALVALAPGEVPRLDTVAIDSRVLAFTFAVSIATGIAFGTVPAWRLSRTSAGVLGAGVRRTMGADRRRAQKALLVSEVALAVALLVGAGLLLRSFHHLVRVEPGFDTAPLATARLSLPPESYPDHESRALFFEGLRGSLEGLSGVAGTAFVSNPPFSGFNNDYTFYVEGMDDVSYSGSEEYREVSPGYFRTLGIPIVAGREFDARDDSKAPPVVVVSESFARKYWNGEDPVGRRIKMGDRESDLPWVTVVGVGGDVRHAGLAASALPMYYRPYLQRTEEIMTLIVRATADPEALLGSIRAEVRRLDPDLALFGVVPMEEKVAASIAQPRFNLILLVVFAVLALALAAVGIYGLARYAVTRRTSEIGLRVALGATRAEIQRMVLLEGLRTAGLGLVLGLLGSAALSRALASVPGLLHGVSAMDLPTYAGVVALLLAVVLLASLAPASKASRIAPVEALRYE